MSVRATIHHLDLHRRDPHFDRVAAAYNRAGDDYVAYADGDATQPFAFDSRYAYADRAIWAQIDTRLTARRGTGARALTVLDAGCGPGTWLWRTVLRGLELGFETITARGFDIAQTQVDHARHLTRDLAAVRGVTLAFETGDLTGALPEADDSVDLSLCLYGVINHLPPAAIGGVFAELARVTAGHTVVTARTVGSLPTIFVDAIDKARHFKQDHARNRCDIEFDDGRRMALPAHLFSARELRHLAEPRFVVEALHGLDLFHSRFAPDPRWNPMTVIRDTALEAPLAELEALYAADPRFIDRAAHLMLIGKRR